jgi:hypothetical protein
MSRGREDGIQGTHNLVCFLQSTLCLRDGRFAWLAGHLWDLVELLGEVGLDELELSFITAEELRASVGVERVGHD